MQVELHWQKDTGVLGIDHSRFCTLICWSEYGPDARRKPLMVSEKPTNGEELLNNQKWSQLHWSTPGGVQTCIKTKQRHHPLHHSEQLVRKTHPSGNLRMRLIRFSLPLSALEQQQQSHYHQTPLHQLLLTTIQQPFQLADWKGFWGSGDFDPFENHFLVKRMRSPLLMNCQPLL